MRLYKRIDYWLQIILITFSILYILLARSFFFTAYFVVGGCQVLSVIIHFILQKFYFPSRSRRYYLWTLAFFIAAGIILYAVQAIIIYAYMLLFFSPFMAIWYVYTCYQESKVLESKTLVHLK